jgi:hypothetical protein
MPRRLIRHALIHIFLCLCFLLPGGLLWNRVEPHQTGLPFSVFVVGFVGLYLSLTQPALLTTLGVFSAAWAAQAVPAAVGGGPPVGEPWPDLQGGR